MINVSVLNTFSSKSTLLKIFGKKTGNTSILLMYKDGTIQNYHVYVNENLGFIQKMINVIGPNLELSKVGNGSTVLSGTFEDPHDKKRIYALLESAGIDMTRLMDLTDTNKVNKMVRTKLYLVQINNQKAEDMGGVTGLGFFNEYIDMVANPLAANSATFSGWLLDNTGSFTSQKGNSLKGTLNFLQTTGIGTILDDTVLMTTEDENASFRVGGEVYIPKGVTQNIGLAPTIQVEEKEYGLKLSLKSDFMEKDDYIHINVNIQDSEFDENKEHDVQLGFGVSVPSFISKHIATNVVVKSGQVIVLGGRLHTEDVQNEEKVPLLGDIPLLGELFKHNVSGVQSNDLLFFLVPEIVDANEDIDDAGFYREFKNSSEVFHKEILDDEASKEESFVVLNDTNVSVEKAAVKESDTKDEIFIEVEDATPVTGTVVTQEIVIEEPEEIDLPEEELVKTELKNAEEMLQKSPIEETQSEEAIRYTVMSEKIFLRDEPISGKRATVWSAGHSFIAEEEKTVKGSTWLKVKEDCYTECVELDEELWISKKYVRLQ